MAYLFDYSKQIVQTKCGFHFSGFWDIFSTDGLVCLRLSEMSENIHLNTTWISTNATSMAENKAA